jgi:CRISPR-associated endonuclease/helicase Cas3
MILAGADERGKHVDDPIYGCAAALTWTWLTSISEGKGKAKFIDFGVEALHKHLPIGQPADPELLAPRKSAPILLPAYVDLWSQTSPPPAADPEPALFLHGPETGPADVTIVWRADFSPD